MDAFHVICGVIRSGSTLICDVLNQNPDFYASSTSPMDRAAAGFKQLCSASPEIKGLLLRANELPGHEEDADSERITREAMRWYLLGGIEQWYKRLAPESKTIFDKGRGWITEYDHLLDLSPNSRLICTVRDPRNVFASCERADKETPGLYEVGAPAGETRLQKIERYFSPQGQIGSVMRHIADKLTMKQNSTSMVYCQYEKFCRDPERELRRIYAECKLDWFSGHNFEDVESTAIDLDVSYNLKFRHDRKRGPIKSSDTRWQDWIPEEIAEQIIKQNPVFCKEFGYQ